MARKYFFRCGREIHANEGVDFRFSDQVGVIQVIDWSPVVRTVSPMSHIHVGK